MESCTTADVDAVWPQWMAYVFAGTGLVLGVTVAAEARPVYSLGVRIALSLVPAALWIVCWLTGRPNFIVRAVVVFATVALLLVHPAQVDLAPFYLVLLICDAVSEAPLASAVIAVVSAALAVALQLSGHFNGALVWAFAFGFTWAGAALVQSRMRLLDVVRDRAVADERQRIARELHDVIAHSLAVTMLQLTGARLALERDPEDAARALAEAERLGRESLAEIRRTVGLLAPDEQAPSAALPTASDVPALVREMSDAGLAVELQCRGELGTVAPGPGLAVYRIVQESLANVVKHAAPGVHASVDVAVNNGVVEVRIANPTDGAAADPTPDERGMGLRSMRERAEALGGTFAIATNAGTWCITAAIPRELKT